MIYKILIIFTVLLGLDFYVFRTIRISTADLNNWFRTGIYILYWSIPLILLSTILIAILFPDKVDFRSGRLFLFAGTILVLFGLPKLVILFFQLVDDLTKLMAYLAFHFAKPGSQISENAEKISRSQFLIRTGLILAAVPFFSLLYGIFVGRFNFSVIHKRLYFSNLPNEFDDFKIVQFSDLHIGSLSGHENQLEKAIGLMNEQKADVIFFTGDMVNNIVDEINGWEKILSSLHAKHGVYSILGNHDYGHYFNWKNDAEKAANLVRLKEKQKEMGFHLLLNDSVSLQKGNNQIAIIGVENWGKAPFPQYGNLAKAKKKVEDIPFKLLLSHDPTHWDEAVEDKEDIALTFSGHTHGMQLAINFAGINWSPVKFKYKHWRGLYKDAQKENYLYVNIGLGYIGFPGRVGTNPEITVFELKRSMS